MRRATLAGAAVAAAALAVAAWVGTHRAASPDQAAPRVAVTDVGRAATDRRAALAARADGGDPLAADREPPGSLAGSRPDGALAAGADGRLIVSPELRRAFEYWFSASGEESDAALAARIAAEIDRQLDDPAQTQALVLLGQFVAYRARARALAEDGLADADLAARVAAVRELRRELFGADGAALFADEETLVDFALAERRIAEDPALSPAERAARLEALREAAPAPVRAARDAALAPQRLAADETQLRAEGASDDDIRRLREERVGAEAAERLAALDAQRAAWRSRVETYRAERSLIDGDPALDANARSAAIAALRDRSFTGPERLRIEALDEIEIE